MSETAAVDDRETAPARPWLAGYPEGVDWHQPLEPRTLPAVFEDAARRFADRPAFDFLGRRQTYGALARQVDATAAGLVRLGIAKGTRVGLMLPNSPFYPMAFFAVLKAGGVVVNLNPLHAREQLRAEIADAGVSVLVTVDLAALSDKAVALLDDDGPLDTVLVGRFAGALPWLKSVAFQFLKSREIAKLPADARVVPFERVTAPGPAVDFPAIAPDDLAVLQFTGGTTGTPKAAMLSHANVTINAAQAAAWFVGAQPGDERLLAVLPFFHVFAMTVGFVMAVELGVEIVALPRFDIDQVMKTVARRKITLLPGVPTIFNAISQHPKRDRYDLSSVRLCISGGAALPLEVKQTFERLTGCTLFEGYGLTEASPVVSCNPVKGNNKPGSIGQPIPGTDIRIQSMEDASVLGLGERGEVCVRGPQVMRGYWNREEENAQTLADGWLRTGDVGVMDEEGYVFIVDRIKDLIITNGYNVYPRTVEEAVYQHPAIAECCVAGVPDAARGEAVKVYASLKPGIGSLTLEELRGFLDDKLSPIEQPRHLEVRDVLPRTLIGKLSRKALKDEEAARRGDGSPG